MVMVGYQKEELENPIIKLIYGVQELGQQVCKL
jgi:hypothetical protein